MFAVLFWVRDRLGYGAGRGEMQSLRLGCGSTHLLHVPCFWALGKHPVMRYLALVIGSELLDEQIVGRRGLFLGCEDGDGD